MPANAKTVNDSRPCAYCALPVPTGPKDHADVPVYCCFGCQFAHCISCGNAAEGDNRQVLTRLGLAVFFTMNVMVFTLALWAWDIYEMSSVASAEVFRQLLRYACLLFAVPVLALLGGPLLSATISSLRQRILTTDVLLLIGVAASFGYSVLSLWQEQRHVYFEVTCMILVAVTLGRWLEANGKQKASECLRGLTRLIPERCRRLEADGERWVATSNVQPGDLIRVSAYEHIPVDGVVQRHPVLVDTHVMTGEAEPQYCAVGEELYGGTLNLQHELFLKTTATSDSGAIQQLMDAVTEAACRRGRYQRLADRLAAAFVPSIFFIAAGTFWVHHSAAGGHHALLSALAVVLIACPCALGIATPLALWAALAVAARNQVLFCDGDAVTKLAGVGAMVLDKTGTLTRGQLHLVQRDYADDCERQQVDRRAARLASASRHRLSQSLLADLESGNDFAARSLGTDGETIEPINDVPGCGVRGTYRGSPILLGSLEFAAQNGQRLPERLAIRATQSNSPGTQVAIAWGGIVHAVYTLREDVREEAAELVHSLRRLGIYLELVSGDRSVRVNQVAAQLGLAAVPNASPYDKLSRVAELRDMFGPIAMVGDGVNDAPALAAADIGISLEEGTDVSRDAADICLLGNSLTRLPWAVRLARDTQRTIQLNLFWAVAYNCVGISLAVGGYLTPIVAAVAMIGSSLIVISNSLRLAARHGDVSREALQAAASAMPARTGKQDGPASDSGADLSSTKADSSGLQHV